MTATRNKQITGNVGMYFACFELSRLGLNVLPTSRNAKGADIIAYTDDHRTFCTIQVKAMSKLANISLGKSLDSVECDWWIVVVDVYANPTAFVLNRDEVIGTAKCYKGKYWAQGKQIATERTRNAWDRIIAKT